MRRWSLVVIGGLGLVLMGCDLIQPPSLLPPTSAPENLSASSGEAETQIELRWQAVERAEYYEIQRAEAQDGEYARVGTSNTPGFSDSVGRDNQGRWYWYKVRACNAAGCGPWSEAVRGYAGRPPAPEEVRASQGDFPDKIKVKWDPVPGASFYQVFRDTTENGGYATIVVINWFEITVDDANVRPATWYWYRVRACNDHGCSALSAAARGYCGPRPMPFAEDENEN